MNEIISTNPMEDSENGQPIESHYKRDAHAQSSLSRGGSVGEHERKHLVGNNSHENRSGDVPNRSEGETVHGDTLEKYPFLLLNIVLTLNSGASRIYTSLIDQYLYQRFANDILGNYSENTAKKPCVNETNQSDSTLLIQDMTSQFSLYISISDYALSVVPCLLLGAYSALIRRKTLLLIPTLATAIKSLDIAAVVYWNLDVQWLYLGYTVEGLGGGTSGILLGIFLYMSDITSRGRKRTFVMTFMEGLKGFISGILYYGTGQLIESTGFIVPTLMAAGCMLLSVCLILLLPERKSKQVSHVRKETADWSLGACYKRLTLPFGKTQHPMVKKMVILALVAFLILLCSLFGQSKIRNLYLMNFPFCWDAVTIGWFLSAQDIAYNLFTMLAVPLFYTCLPGMGLAIVGLVSCMAGTTMYALADTSLEIYLIIGLSIANNVAFGLIRGETSRLLDGESQGSLFATVAMFESLSFLCGTPALLLYSATVGWYSGFSFFLMDVLLIVALVLLCMYQSLWVRYTREVQSKELLVEKYGSINS
ncbi:proton-coupled folate transporter [Biomphalaria glabrata]|nr:proton-coupled folate transporter [Biomphalaria glabrata]